MPAGAWPSAKDVRSDLVFLRRRYGIRYESMSGLEHLPALRVVENEAERQGRDLETDGAHIAYEVVRCVAYSESLLGERMKRLLVQTLNFDQTDTVLEERRTALKGELLLSDDAYEDFEERAFQQLAGVLLSLDRSPCAEESSPSAEAAAFLRLWRTTGDYEAIRLIEMGFGRLLLTRTHEEAVQEAGRILEAIPAGITFADGHLGTASEDALARLFAIMRAIITQVYDEYLAAEGISFDQVLRGIYVEDYLNYVEASEFERGFESSARSSATVANERWAINREEGSRLREVHLVQFKLNGAFLIFARIMSELEANNSWDRLRPLGQGDRLSTPVG